MTVRVTKEVVLVARADEEPPVRVTKEVLLVAYDPQTVGPDPTTPRLIPPILFGW